MNDQWQSYAQKNEAFTRKWAAAVRRALDKQLKRYVETYRAGRPDTSVFASFELAEVLYRIYGDVGMYYARETNRELLPFAKVSPVTGSIDKRHVKKEYRGLAGDIDRVKRGSLGFSLDWAQRIINRLRISGLNLAQKISSTTRKKVLSILEEAQTENLSLDETVKLLTEKVQEFNANRAETIVRTEVGRAAGEGKMIGAKALGVQLQKKWVSARDYRTRHNPAKDPKKGDHWILNGQVKPMDEPFTNGVHQLMQPGDSNAPASEVVNCRCTVVFEVVTDEQGRAIPQTYLDSPINGPSTIREAASLLAL